METIKLTQDFKQFLSLLNSEKIEYLLIGGYAVWLYGYVCRTKDMDIWVAIDPVNENRLVEVLVKFGFARDSVKLPPDREYWWSQTLEKRLRELERLRQLNYGYGNGKPLPKFERILRVADMGRE
jgi:hypothetical protein